MCGKGPVCCWAGLQCHDTEGRERWSTQEGERVWSLGALSSQPQVLAFASGSIYVSCSSLHWIQRELAYGGVNESKNMSTAAKERRIKE